MGASLIAGALSRNRRKKEERRRYLEAIGETFFFSTLPGTPTKRRPLPNPDSAPDMPGTPRRPDPDSAPDMPGDPIGTKRLPAADPFAPPKRPPKRPDPPHIPSAQEQKRQGDLAGKQRDWTDVKKQKRELAGKLALLERLNPNGESTEDYDFLGEESDGSSIAEKYKEALEEAEDLYDLLKSMGEIDSEAEDVLEYIKGGALEIPEPELPPIEYVE